MDPIKQIYLQKGERHERHVHVTWDGQYLPHPLTQKATNWHEPTHAQTLVTHQFSAKSVKKCLTNRWLTKKIHIFCKISSFCHIQPISAIHGPKKDSQRQVVSHLKCTSIHAAQAIVFRDVQPPVTFLLSTLWTVLASSWGRGSKCGLYSTALLHYSLYFSCTIRP